MKIIKDGIKPDMDISRLFTCHFCDCKFYAEKGEYKWSWTIRPNFADDPVAFQLEAKCPCCNKIVEIIERGPRIVELGG